MKKTAIIIAFGILLFSCGKNEEATESKTETVEAETTEVKGSKFEDKYGCKQYANLYEALPHLDTYKNLECTELQCIDTNESSPFSTAMEISYFNNTTMTNMKVYLYEISGESAKEELNNITMAKASFNELTKLPGTFTYKSSLTTFDNASVRISQSEVETEKSTATYLGTWKDKYSIWINVEMPGKIDVAKVDALLKEYLEAFKKDELK